MCPLLPLFGRSVGLECVPECVPCFRNTRLTDPKASSIRTRDVLETGGRGVPRGQDKAMPKSETIRSTLAVNSCDQLWRSTPAVNSRGRLRG